jgi:hypothetical protein
VAEFVRQHNQKQRQILQCAPDDRGVPALPVLDFNDGDEKPGPMQEYVNSRNAAKMDGTLT